MYDKLYMDISFEKILNIRTLDDLYYFLSSYFRSKNKILSELVNIPLKNNNLIHHYLILFNNIDAIKLTKYPIYKENDDNLNGFHLAAKEKFLTILKYLIDNYPEYIYNTNELNETFVHFLDINSIVNLVLLYPKLKWVELLFDDSIINDLMLYLDYKYLSELLKVIKIPVTTSNQYLEYIIKNNNLTNIEKIKILDNYSLKKLNITDKYLTGLIYHAINNESFEIFEYLINRCVMFNYTSYKYKKSVLYSSFIIDIYNNTFKFSKLLFKAYNSKWKNTSWMYTLDPNLNNILHNILKLRVVIKNYNIFEIDKILLKDSNTELFHQKNVFKQTPWELLILLDFERYHKLVNHIKISNILYTKLNNIDSKWNKFLQNKLDTNYHYIDTLRMEKLDILYNKDLNLKPIYDLVEYKTIDNIKLSFYPYTISSIYKSSEIDVILYIIYIKNRYSDIFIPFNNIYFNNPIEDINLTNPNLLPFIITYIHKNEYYICKYLNKILTDALKNNRYNLGIILLFIHVEDNIFHSNILIYNFKHLTIERFDPYGNSRLYDDKVMDKILEEELTWNLPYKYIRCKDYMPQKSFQLMSDESNDAYTKSGDIGGFCVAWCFWYLEIKRLNLKIKSKILIKKLMNILSNTEYMYINYIRNYANYLTHIKYNYLLHIGLDINVISSEQVFNDNIRKMIIKSYLN